MPKASFKNVGALQSECITKFIFYTDTLEGVLNINEERQFSFKPWRATSDEVKLEARVLFELDQNPENDVGVKEYTDIEESRQKGVCLRRSWLYYSKPRLVESL